MTAGVTPVFHTQITTAPHTTDTRFPTLSPSRHLRRREPRL